MSFKILRSKDKEVSRKDAKPQKKQYQPGYSVFSKKSYICLELI